MKKFILYTFILSSTLIFTGQDPKELDDFESSLDTSTFGPINTTNFPSETLFSIGGAKDPLFGLSEVDKICHRKEIERLNRERAEKLKKE